MTSLEIEIPKEREINNYEQYDIYSEIYAYVLLMQMQRNAMHAIMPMQKIVIAPSSDHEINVHDVISARRQ